MILVIAEKPSVAQSIAKVLGATSRKDGYMEGGNYIVSWCFGHLVELADASSYAFLFQTILLFHQIELHLQEVHGRGHSFVKCQEHRPL